MSSPATPVSPATQSESLQPLWRRLADLLVRRRVHISLVVFVLLITEDVLEPLRPHGVTDFGDVKSVLGLGLVLTGLALRSWAAGILRKQEQLTTGGPYALFRHPLYIGSFLMMVGFCTLIDDAENIWVVLGPFVGLYLLGIFAEERMLRKRFSVAWREYARTVPRFLPRRLRPEVLAPWSRAQWLKNREYRAVTATLVGLVAIQIWHMM